MALQIRTQSPFFVKGIEVSVFYFRAGYRPDEYVSRKEWDLRLVIEKSKAIKCPNIAFQIVGCKKFQQELTDPKVLERFVSGEDEKTALLQTFTEIYPLDQTPKGQEALSKAISQPEHFVLKPQREGGGNNIYGKDIPAFLNQLLPHERSGYVLMKLIRSKSSDNFFLHHTGLFKVETVSELGIYGLFLSDGSTELLNESYGHLLRTKKVSSNEGGIAQGSSVLDSPILY